MSSPSIPLPLHFSEIKPAGDLAFRAGKNFDRLEEEKYQPAHVFLASENEWPGDTEGRTVLALTLLTQALDRKPKYLEAIVDAFPAHFNSDGYFGAKHLPDIMDEQQFSSHGWVLRALCEEYLRTQSPSVKAMIDKMVQNLVLPTRGFHSAYPIDPKERVFAGAHGGNIANQIGAWRLSTDIGCDFIFLDGIVQAWELFPTPELKSIIDEIIARFLEVDLVAIEAQTHATLTGLRAILRYSRAASQPHLVVEVEKRFQLYLAEAWTENFANYNWFQRPKWTEPCAIVDSFIVAVDLWQITRNADYLKDAHLTYYNALGHGQRANGGFGCDTCVGAGDPVIRISVIEAHWCCTMRGGEGLARAIQYLGFQNPGELYLPFFNDCEMNLATAAGALHLKQTTHYPYRGQVQIEVLDGTVPQEVSLFFYLPPWHDNPHIAFNGKPASADLESGFMKWSGQLKPGDHLSYDFDLQLTRTGVTNHHSIAGHTLLRHGPLLLACEKVPTGPVELPSKISADARYQVNGINLAPINDMIHQPAATKENYARQLLFPS
jgi:hypothetical protein